MVVVEQIEALLDFLQARPDLALGNMSRTKEGRSLAKHLWMECAKILNNATPNCPQKTPENWRMFYNEYKCKLFKKVKARKSDYSHSGSSPANVNTLTPLQKRLYLMLGLDFGEPLLGGTYDPLYQDSENGNGEDSSYNCNSYNTISSDNGDVKPKRESQRIKQASEVIYEAPVSPGLSDEDQSQSPIEDEPAPAPPPKRKRQRHHSKRERTRDHDQIVLETLERLKRIEAATSKAIQKQANATNRLAAAIERISDRLSEPLVVLVKETSKKKKRYLRIVMSSESSESDDSASACSDEKEMVIPANNESSTSDYCVTSIDPRVK